MTDQNTVNEIRPYGPGKFATIVDSYVYDASLDGCDEETGSVDEVGAWYGLLRGPIDVTADDLTLAERAYLSAAKGGAIVSEDSQGFVDVVCYETAEALNAAWATIEAEIAEVYGDESEDQN